MNISSGVPSILKVSKMEVTNKFEIQESAAQNYRSLEESSCSQISTFQTPMPRCSQGPSATITNGIAK